MFMIRRVEGRSMLPAYEPGTIVLGLKRQKPAVGSVVVARLQDREIIKRVAQVREQGYFLLGDNASSSTDSRTYGWFTADSIEGVVIGSIKL